MSGRQRAELLCGIGACVWGLLLLLAAYLQPSFESNATTRNLLQTHLGFTAIEVPYLIAAGLPILGVTIGAITDSLTASTATRLLLWIATVILGIEMLVGAMTPVGLLVGPSFLLGLCASLLARPTQRGAPGSVTT